jgi:hypothetical protein
VRLRRADRRRREARCDAKIELKKAPTYKVIGKSIRRVDIPAKVTGEFTYVHDVRVPACCMPG